MSLESDLIISILKQVCHFVSLAIGFMSYYGLVSTEITIHLYVSIKSHCAYHVSKTVFIF